MMVLNTIQILFLNIILASCTANNVDMETESTPTNPSIVTTSSSPPPNPAADFSWGGDLGDGFINFFEKDQNLPLFTLESSAGVTAEYEIVSSSVDCSSVSSFSFTDVPRVFELSTDGSFKVCARLTSLDPRVAPVVLSSSAFIRDTEAPVFTSMTLENQLTDNAINAGEVAATDSLVSVIVTGHTAVFYSVIVDPSLGLPGDPVPAASCNPPVIVTGSSAPSAVDIPANGNYIICSKALDTAGNAAYKPSTIFSRSGNEAPTNISLSSSSIAENNTTPTVVGSLSTTDPDGGGHVYALVAGTGDTDNASFQINGSNLEVTTALDFEVKNSYLIRLSSTDVGTLSFQKQFTITVTNVNEAPTNISLSSSSIAENNSNPAIVAGLSTTDPDGGSHTYALVAGTGDTDNASFQINGANLEVTAVLDFETKSSYLIRLSSTDGGGLSFEKQFTITVTDGNEAPSNILLSSSIIAENNANPAVVGGLSTTDSDGGSHTYALVAGTGDTDNANFQINGTNLEVRTVLDFESKSSYLIRLKSTDGGGLSFEKQFTITVSDVNEAPTNIFLSSSSIVENNANPAVIGGLSTTDPEGGSHTYALAAGTGDIDNSSFQINGTNLEVRTILDFESKSSYSIRLSSTDGGSLSFQKQFTITVTDVNEAPTNISLSSSSIAEKNVNPTVVGALSTTDSEGGSHTYALVAGTGDSDNANFQINGTNLEVTTVLDFETKSSYLIRLSSTDSGTLSFQKQFTITVTNVNETPTDINLSANTLVEGLAANSVVGSFVTTDVDSGDSHTYSLVSGTGDTDNTSFNISGASLRSDAVLTAGPKLVRIRSTDSGTGNLYFEKQFTITVTASGGPAVCSGTDVANTSTYGSGNGSSSTPYVICNIEGLERINDDATARSLHYEVGIDIDLDPGTCNIGNSFVPIGNCTGGDCKADTDAFTGSFNGFDYNLSNLCLNFGTGEKAVGFFGLASATSVISNLKLTNVNVTTASGMVGAVVGVSKGTLYNIYVSGTVDGNAVGVTAAGMIAGRLGYLNPAGTITGGRGFHHLTADSANLTAKDNTGGIVGYLSGVLSAAYFSGVVNGANNTGGIVGKVNWKESTAAYKTDSPIILSQLKVTDATNSKIYGQDNTGGLVGLATKGVVLDSSFLGNLVSGTNKVGGIIGNHDGVKRSSLQQLDRLQSEGTILGANSVGGILGFGSGSYSYPSYQPSIQLRDSFSKGSVSASSSKAGGLVGEWNGTSGMGSYAIHYGFNTSNHSGIKNSFSAADVAAPSSFAGGLVGKSTTSSFLADSFATGKVTSGSTVYGLVGADNMDQKLNLFWYDQTSDSVGSAGVTATSVANISDLYDVDYSEATGTDPWSMYTYWSFSGDANVWKENAGNFPSFATINNAFSGSGTFLDPYEISTVAQFNKISVNPFFLNKHFKLTANLNFAAGTLNQIGNKDYPFTGSIDGDEFIISNFNGTNSTNNSSASGNDYQGVVGFGLGSYIHDLTINSNTGAYALKGRMAVGILAGACHFCTITNVNTSGQVAGYGTTGGMVGDFHGSIATHSSSSANVSSTYSTGGLIGRMFDVNLNGSTLDSCFATGTVTETGSFSGAGGLVGNVIGGTIIESYATGDVAGTTEVGGLVGYVETNVGAVPTVIRNSFATGNVAASGGRAGGLVGDAKSNLTINSSFYAPGSGNTITGSTKGGIVGRNAGIINDSFAVFTVVTGINTGTITNSSANATESTYHGSGDAVFASWNFSNFWNGNVGALPTLK